MPQLGESVVEGTVGKWLKQVGDHVAQYEPIIEVITDKVTTEIPSPGEGTLLEILVPEGTTVNAGTVIGVIGASQTTDGSQPTAVVSSQPSVVSNQSPAPGLRSTTDGSQRNRFTPVVARMIAEFNITSAELAAIQGTGDGGRISKKDLENFLKAREIKPAAPPAAPSMPSAPPAPSAPSIPAVPPAPAVPSFPSVSPHADTDTLVPLTPMRRAIAEHMTRSKQTIPHVTSIHEADMTRVIAHLQANQAAFARQGVKLTYTAYFVQAAVAALQAMPLVNAQYSEQGIIMKRALNIGIAVGLEDGLIVPVLKDAADKNLLGLARAVNDLATRAREKKLVPDDVQGATFTLTNYGVFGSLFGTPIIPFGTTAILGLGAIQKRVVVRGDAIAIRSMVYLGLTFDHRVLDAAGGDRFMGILKEYLENYQGL